MTHLTKVYWDALLEYCCPFCGDVIDFNDKTQKYECMGCEFTITKTRYEQIVESMTSVDNPREFYG